MSSPPAAAPEPDFSLVEDPLLRVQRRLRLALPQRLSIVRRAVLLALLTWLPIAIWAALEGRWFTPAVGEPLLGQFGVHVRCLLGIPLLIVADRLVSGALGRILPHFVSSGLVPEAAWERFADDLQRSVRLRDSRWAWLAIVALVAVGVIFAIWNAPKGEVLNWALDGQRLGFGGYWFVCVARPIYQLLLLAWLWRLVVLILLFRRIAALGLRLVPGHPDGVGGLGFVEFVPMAFAGVSLAMAVGLASGSAHAIVYHGVELEALVPLAVAALVVIPGLMLAPLAAFGPALRRVRLRSRLQYGTLAGRFGHLLHARWVEGTQVEDAILDAPELGPAADVATLYAQVAAMRYLPIGRIALLGALLPVVIPILVVVAIKVPLKDTLLQLLKALM